MRKFFRLYFPLILLGGLLTSRAARAQEVPSAMPERMPYTETIPSTLIELEMVPVPGGTVTIETPSGKKRVETGPFWMSRTEIPWEAFDVWVYSLDEETASGAADALSRPSKPYVLAGDEFGHNGYPALGMTRHAAAEYARWLSAKTGKTYRLPTPAQWKHACLLSLGEAEPPPDALGQHAWYAENADAKTHPVASKQPGALGVYDLLGNAAEWVAAPDGASERTPVIRGGSFRSEAAEVSCTARTKQTPAWNASDPQLPKSEWWLADAPFVGFRLVRVN